MLVTYLVVVFVTGIVVGGFDTLVEMLISKRLFIFLQNSRWTPFCASISRRFRDCCCANGYCNLCGR